MSSAETRLEVTLLRTARAIRRTFDVRLAVLGLNMTEGALLSFARDDGPLTQRELADRLHIGRAAAGGFIDGLVNRGLVRREADSADRRVWLIFLTKEGERVCAEFEKIDLAVRRDLRRDFSIDERRLLAELLGRLEENAIAAAGGEGPDADVPEFDVAPRRERRSDALTARRGRSARA